MDDEQTARAAYAAFNSRDVDAALSLMHPDVDWPNAWEGGRVKGRQAVREYWTRQFEAILSDVQPLSLTEEPGGSLLVEVRQVVHDAATGDLISEGKVEHRYWRENGLVTKMEVVETESG